MSPKGGGWGGMISRQSSVAMDTQTRDWRSPVTEPHGLPIPVTFAIQVRRTCCTTGLKQFTSRIGLIVFQAEETFSVMSSRKVQLKFSGVSSGAQGHRWFHGSTLSPLSSKKTFSVIPYWCHVIMWLCDRAVIFESIVSCKRN